MANESILVGYENEDIREIIVMMLESEFDHDIIEVDSGKVAITEIVKNEAIKVLVFDLSLKETPGDEVYLANKDLKNLPFVFITRGDLSEIESLSKFHEDNLNNAKLNMPFDHEEFTEIISKALLSLATESNLEHIAIPISKGSKYYRIKLTRFLKFTKSMSDTFIKLSGEKYIKILDIDEVVDQGKFQRYLDKGLEYLHLDKEQFNSYLDKRVNALMEKLDQTDLESGEAVSLHLETIQQVQEVAMSIGVKKQIIELADKLTDNVINTIKKNKNFKDFLSPTSSKKGYQFEHSNLVNYLVCGMANHIKSLSTDQASQKLIQASLFCDIGLSDNSHIQIISKEDARYVELERIDKKSIDTHMQLGGASIGKTNHPMADDIEKIILSHHEKPDGTGFPRGLTNKKIPQLSAAFIVAYDLANKIIMGGEKENINIDLILEKMGSAYKEGNFQVPYQALLSALK